MQTSANSPIAGARSDRERARFVSTTPAAYSRLSRGDPASPEKRLPTSLLLNI